MKILILALKRVFALILNEKVTFSLFFISLVITITSFLYFYSFYKGVKTEQEKIDVSTRRYTIITHNSKNPNNILELLINGTYFKPDMIKVVSSEYKKHKKKYTFTASFPKNTRYFIAQGRYFNEEELNSDLFIAIMGAQLINIDKSVEYIGKKININGQVYTNIGIDNFFDRDMITIPMNTFLKEHFKMENIEFIINSKTSKDSLIEFEKKINLISRNTILIKPQEVNLDIVGSFVSSLIIAILIITLAVINILYLFDYLIEKRKREYTIMIICGATNIKTILSVLIELFIITSTGYVAALFIFFQLVNKVIINMDVKLEFYLIDYLIVFLIISVITIISSLPIISIFKKNSLALPVRN